MGQVKISLVTFSVCLLLAGCSSSMGVKGDKAQIRKSLSTMDDADREVAKAKMEWLVENGLYDPDNENSLQVGEAAPDFELMPLRFYDFAIDQGITKDNAQSLFEPVALSSFLDSLPVVLIFGSYT